MSRSCLMEWQLAYAWVDFIRGLQMVHFCHKGYAIEAAQRRLRVLRVSRDVLPDRRLGSDNAFALSLQPPLVGTRTTRDLMFLRAEQTRRTHSVGLRNLEE